MKIIRKTVGFLGRNFLDIRGALGVGQLKQSLSVLGQGFKSVFKPLSRQERTRESFNDAVVRLGLTPDDLQARYQSYRKGFYGYLALSFSLLIYLIHLVMEGFYNAALVCLAVLMLTLVFAFRRHFWMFQIKEQKLGCTLRDWLDSIIK